MPNPTVIQQASSASSAAAPATFTTPAFTASTAGTLLVALVAFAQSGAASITGPVGWSVTASASNAGNTLGGRIFFLPNNPGGVTTAAFTALAGINGIAVAIYEISNVIAASPLDLNNTAYANSTTIVGTGGTLVPRLGNEVYLGFETDLTGQAYTNQSNAVYVAGTTATSTVGATNCIIRPFSAIPGSEVPSPGTLGISGTLAGALACGGGNASFITSVSSILAVGPGGQVLATAGSGYGIGI